METATLALRGVAEQVVLERHHHPRFDIDEAALPTAIDLLVGVVERYLGGER